MKKNKFFLFEILILLIISIPAFLSLLNKFYFTIHDNQHLVRLYLLDKGIKQGYLYPRWVDQLTFGFGDPLFNFYPPLVYYLAEFFHLIGFSYIWSIKLVFIFGFIVGVTSSYYFVKEFLGKMAGFLGATIFTYFFYHGVNAYVRGALSEFFAMNLVPFVFLFFYRLAKNPDLKTSLCFSLSLALVFLAHQLVALPLVFFLFFYFLYCLFISSDKKRFFYLSIFGGLLGLGLASFYWLPMFYERQFTFLDMELGSYRDHFVNPYQFWYSPWGFGASVKGIDDGMTFQLGKIPILLISFSIISFFLYQLFLKEKNGYLNQFIFFLFLAVFGLWMTTSNSSFLWDNLKILWNLQFPWRFLSITAIFISLVASYWVAFQRKFFSNKKFIINFLVIFFITLTIFKYQKYFYPQKYLDVKDDDLLTKDEIEWRQSQTVLHFVPKGVKAKKNQYGVHVLDVEKKDLPKKIYEIKKGRGEIKILKNNYQEKEFEVRAASPILFQLNTFHFVGWQAYLNGKRIEINDDNRFKLITVSLPQGQHFLRFVFTDPLIRKIGNLISLVSLIIFVFFIVISLKFLRKKRAYNYFF